MSVRTPGIAQIQPMKTLSCCPFCASHDVDLMMPADEKAYVLCRGCGARGPARGDQYETSVGWEASVFRPGILL